MYNYYDFDADFPQQKAAQKFLLSDYFHDSVIRSVELNNDKRDLVIQLQCCRDWENDRRATFDDLRYTYILHFTGVYGFRSVTESRTPEYINGRFKQTEWLNEQQQRAKRKLYHFRIGLSDGFIDLLFCSFSIRKAVGRISYKGIGELDAFHKEWYHRSAEQVSGIISKLQADVSDSVCDLNLELLYANGVKDLRSICHTIITGKTSPDAKAYAAWLLGKCGTREDLQLIWDLYRTETERKEYEFGSDDPMKYRNLLDALENLNHYE